MKALINKIRYPSLGSIIGKFDRMINQLEKLVDTHGERAESHNRKAVIENGRASILRREQDQARTVVANLKTLTGSN